ncbi:MAG: M14 family zinc carboxypeptidase [Stackebrandtia sp.]
MNIRRSVVGLASAAAIVAASGLAGAAPASADPGDEPVSWRVSEISPDEVATLEGDGFDVAHLESDGSAIVIGDEATADELRSRGFDTEFHDTVYKDVAAGWTAAEGTYYGGYHTVEAHEAHLDEVAAAHPDLATVYDVGDSWLKTQGNGGHDIKAICLTKKADGDCELSPDSAKPRFTMIGQIHARELSTGEVSWKWIDALVEGYGQDDEITQMMDTTEMWVVPIANPDGVDIVASGGDNPILQRKNANDSAGGCGDAFGVDLNRNSSHEWGGDSDDPCAETYQGESAASEPEVAGLEEFFRQVHPDQRGEDPNDPAPDDARDVFITLHSFGEYIIIPWGYTEDPSPNDGQLRALGEKMAESNGYLVGTNGDTVGYSTSGTTDDMTYGALGVASFTFEMGGDAGQCGGFLPAYECIDSELWPSNFGALKTAAKAAAAPYAG